MNLKKLLKIKEIKQQVLAKELGVPQSLISKWCSGLNLPRLPEYFKLKKILNLTDDEACVLFALDI